MLRLGLILLAVFAVQAMLSGIQMRHFTKEFIRLRKRERVACGRQAGGFHAGAIVLFLVGEDGIIKEGRMLMGVTCFARVRPLSGFEGKQVGKLTESDLPKYGKNLRKAILDARNTYNKFMSGEAIPEPLPPLQRAGHALARIGKAAG